MDIVNFPLKVKVKEAAMILLITILLFFGKLLKKEEKKYFPVYEPLKGPLPLLGVMM